MSPRRISKSIGEFGKILSREAGVRETRPVGDGWKTIDEIAEEIGLQKRAASDHISRWKKLGLVEVFRGFEVGDGNRLIGRAWYRPTKKSRMKS